ncbi:MAG: hypothetical protein ACOZNI_13565 [Myxococcota bacterium]
MPVACDEPAETAEAVYTCEALPAWEAGHAKTAGEAAARALALDPGYAPARLLEGYAMLRTRRLEEGVAALRAIEGDPDVGALARRAANANDHRWDRGQVGIAVGTGVVMELYFLELTVPVSPSCRLRGSVADSRFGGVIVSATGWCGKIFGTWNVDAGVGPMTRVSDEFAYVGARLLGGVDVRPVRWVGLRVDGGLEVTVNGWGAPVLARAMVVTWLP